MPRSSLAAEKLLPLLLDNLQDYALFMMDLQGHVVAWTPGVLRVLGYEEAEFLGQSAEIIFTLEDRGQGVPEAEMNHARQSGRSDDMRWHLRKDETRFWANGQLISLVDESGQLHGFAKLLRDDTERKKNEDALMQAHQQAEATNRIKNEFLATLSHELRSPLNAILGWANVLRTNQLDETTQQSGLEAIERNARSQAQLIEDLLDVSRILTGKMRLELRPVELAQLVEHAVKNAAPAAQAKGIRLVSHLDHSVSLISGDPDRLGQIFWNLLANAVKFTPGGGRITVSLEVVDSEGDSLVQVQVSDTGKGISPEFLPHVFERFRQGDASSTRAHGGLGIGLGLVRHLTEAHGGTVHAHSEGEGQGASFTVCLPLLSVRSDAPEMNLVAREAAVEVEAGHEGSGDVAAEPLLPVEDVAPLQLCGLNVLVVDDEPDTRALTALCLRQAGATVETADSAADAFAKVIAGCEQGHSFDILVSDVGMPEEDGLSLIRRIRSSEHSASGFLPAVAVTAYAGHKNYLEALQAGFQAHISKPVDPLELVATIASLCGRTGQGENLI